MYREQILDHYKNPRNFQILENPDIVFHDSNPLCGDVIDWYALVEGDKITKIRFQAEGCAISRAASSMLAEIIEGKSFREVLSIKNEDVFDMLGVELTPMRIKCALLGIKALQKAIVRYESVKN